MIITKKVIKEVNEVVAIQCHQCGEYFEPTSTIQNFKTSIGQSMSAFDFWLCETCLTNIVKGLLVVPENFMNESGYVPTFISDHELHQTLFDEWKITNEWNYDEDPWKEYYSSDNSNQEFEEYEEYNEEIYDVKPLHTNILKLVIKEE